ncbi:MAG: hypothetical protein K8T90_08500 [Planctomycetes bacterium]|nr:hypothetical protein [Planctomycetota bacterium]
MTFRSWLRPACAAGLLVLAGALADAAHYTPYLDYVQNAVNERIAEIGTPDTKLESRELALLKGARSDLAKSSAKLSSDLKLLAAALVHLRQLTAGMAPGMSNNVSLSVGMLSQELDMLAMNVQQNTDIYEQHGGKRATVKTLRSLHKQGWAFFQKAANAKNHQQACTFYAQSAALMEKATALLAKVQQPV